LRGLALAEFKAGTAKKYH